MNQFTRPKSSYLIIAAAILLLLFPSAPVFSSESGQPGDPVLIGVLANRGYDLCLQEWGPTAEYLSVELAPLSFEIVPLGFDEIFSSVSEGKVSYIAANPSYYAYLEYFGLANRIVTLQLPGEPEPQPLFGGVIFTRADRADINTLEDLNGLAFAAVNENSLGGWHAALREIIAAGIEPEKDFRNIIFKGTHDQVALAVLNGEVDAGTVRSSQLERMSVEGLLNLEDMKIINNQAQRYTDYPYRLSTALYPEWPFAALKSTDSELNRSVAVALLMMNQQDPAALALRGAGWAVAQDYGSVHELLRELSLPPYDQPVSFTLTQVIRQYWVWIVLLLLVLLLGWGFYWRMALMSRKIRQVADELKASETQSRALIAAIPDMLFRYDREGNYLDIEVKEHSLMMIKTRDLYQKNELVGKNICDVLPSQIAENLLDRIKRAIDKNRLQEFEYSYQVGDEVRHFESRLVATGNNQVVSIVRDITAEKSFNDELKYVSFHDPLTGLYNRSYFESEIERLEGSREYPIVVISVDLDGLKLINDTFGHKAGDDYLVAGANILKEATRKADLVARVGGDEFVMVLPRTDYDYGQKLIERIRNMIEQYNDDSGTLPVSMSMGIGICENDQRSLEEAYILADRVMYSDKLHRSGEARSNIVRTLLANMYESDCISADRSELIQALAVKLGLKAGLMEQQLADLVLLAQVYELGKAVTDEAVLVKPGKLTEAEWDIIRQHPEKGYRIASASPDLAAVSDFILKHHENWDGSGYPLCLRGEEIPLESRILAIVNAYTAMVNPRPYANTLNAAAALEEIKRCAGKQFDPHLAKLFIEIMAAEQFTA